MEQILNRIRLLAGEKGDGISQIKLNLIQNRWQGYVTLAKSGRKIQISED